MIESDLHDLFENTCSPQLYWLHIVLQHHQGIKHHKWWSSIGVGIIRSNIISIVTFWLSLDFGRLDILPLEEVTIETIMPRLSLMKLIGLQLLGRLNQRCNLVNMRIILILWVLCNTHNLVILNHYIPQDWRVASMDHEDPPQEPLQRFTLISPT